MVTKERAQDIARELEAFRLSAERFSESKPNLIDKYDRRWVAIHEGEVVADAASVGELIEELERRQMPLSQTMIRYLSKEPRRFIL